MKLLLWIWSSFSHFSRKPVHFSNVHMNFFYSSFLEVAIPKAEIKFKFYCRHEKINAVKKEQSSKVVLRQATKEVERKTFMKSEIRSFLQVDVSFFFFLFTFSKNGSLTTEKGFITIFSVHSLICAEHTQQMFHWIEIAFIDQTWARFHCIYFYDSFDLWVMNE